MLDHSRLRCLVVSSLIFLYQTTGLRQTPSFVSTVVYIMCCHYTVGQQRVPILLCGCDRSDRTLSFETARTVFMRTRIRFSDKGLETTDMFLLHNLLQTH
jgi:hypothetical protein